MAVDLRHEERVRPTINGWADEHLVNGKAPEWVLPLFSTIKDEFDTFDLQLAVYKLFAVPPLSGSRTAPDEFLEFIVGMLKSELVHTSGWILERLCTLATSHSDGDLEVVRTVKTLCSRPRNTVPKHPWVESYHRYLLAKGRAKRTAYNHMQLAQGFIDWLYKTEKLELNRSLYRLEHADVEQYIQTLRRKAKSGEMKYTTASTASRIPLSFLRFCKSQLGLHDVVQGATGFQGKPNEELWIPSHEQVDAFFSAIIDYSSAPIMHLCLFGTMYSLGLRPVEVLHLTWDGIEWEDRKVRFREKGGGQTTMVLPESTFEVLRKWYLRSAVTSGPIFTEGPRRTQVNERRLRSLFRAFVYISGWDQEAHPSVLRHAFCTHLLIATNDYVLVNQLARHAKFNTTEFYIHLSKQHYRDAVDKVHREIHD